MSRTFRDWQRQTIGAVLLMGLLVVGGCDSSSGPQGDDPVAATACQLAPIARQVATELRAALAAAQHRDQATMSKAAGRAQALGQQISDATVNLRPQTSPDRLLEALTSIGLFGLQGGFSFGDELPDPHGLASFQAGLMVLDQELVQLHADLPADC